MSEPSRSPWRDADEPSPEEIAGYEARKREVRSESLSRLPDRRRSRIEAERLVRVATLRDPAIERGRA